MKTNESAENYLETILMLKKEKGAVRSIDIVHQMEFTKPSVSRAMSILKKNGYITVDADGYISLTPSGLDIAQSMYTRHTVLTQLLIELGVDEKTAAEDACRIEHVISEKSFAAVKTHLEWAAARKKED